MGKVVFEPNEIPLSIKALSRWAPYELIWNAKRQKFDKIPRNPRRPKKRLSTSRPELWGTFEEACQAMEAEGLNGVGLLLTGYHDVVGLDLDQCFENGVLKPWARDIVRTLKTYAELSPSGEGIRLFGLGTIPFDWCNHEVGIEVYGGHESRFLTTTGNLWPGAEEDLCVLDPEALEAITEQYGGSRSQAEVIRLQMPELVDEVDIPTTLNEEARKFLEGLDQSEDRSGALHWCAVSLLSTGLSEQETLSLLANNTHALEVALDHRRQDYDRALTYLWVHHVQKAQPKVCPSASEADFEDISDPLLQAVDRLSRLSDVEYDACRASEAKTLGVRVAVLDKAVKEERNRRQVTRARRSSEGQVSKAIEGINKNHCVAWCGGELNIMRMVDGDWVPTDIGSLRRWFANKLVLAPGALGLLEAQNPANLWLASKGRIEYSGVKFSPGRTLPQTELNLWNGWALEPELGDISPFMRLTEEVVFGNSPLLVPWALDWLAHLFQRPDELPGKAILLRSGQGVGKNTWIDTVKVPLGSGFIQVNSQKQLCGDFNAHLANKLLVHAAESLWGGDKGKVGPLKAMITDEDQAVEYKGRDVFMVRNYKRLILSSNENWPIPLDRDDRRFVISECVKAFPDNHPFWVDYRKWRKSGGAARVFGFLLNRDISNFKPWERLPDLHTSWAIKLRSSDALTKFWFFILQSGDPSEVFELIDKHGDWTENVGVGYALAIPRQKFWDCFSDWVRKTGTHCAPEVQDRKKILSDLCPSMTVRGVASLDRAACFTFPSLKQCRQEFADALGGLIDDVFSLEEVAID